MNTGSYLQGLGDRPGQPPLEAASSTPITADWKTPGSALISQAMMVEKQRRKAEKQKKKKKKMSQPGILINFMKKAMRKKKKKKKKSKVPPGGGSPPGSSGSSSSSTSTLAAGAKKKKKRKRKTLPDGTTVSFSADSSTPSASSQESDSSDLEAPMKRRSRKNPGAIIELLIAHVQEQLHQAATLDVNSHTSPVISGVRVATFFSLHVRNQFPFANRELREMYSLSRAIDLLRAGQVPAAGDILAARFMALHQSLLDNSWVSAQHMELAPLEEASAASPALVLATRRHTKLYQKVQGADLVGGNYGRARPRNWSGWSENRAEPFQKGKGKGTKGGKGKGKDKGRGKASGQSNPWATTLEKHEDKPPPKA